MPGDLTQPDSQSDLRVITERLGVIQRDVFDLKTDIRSQLKDHEDRIRELEEKQITLAARVNNFAIFQAIYATVGSIAAAFFGVRQ